ncbi:MAG: HAD family phosphatase [Bifidobacterium sp.]|nr:HAD family phosphatase [Bifidobacterium sp.]
MVQREARPDDPGMATDTIMARDAAEEADGRPIRHVIFDFGNVLVRCGQRTALLPRYTDRQIDGFLDGDLSGFAEANERMDAGADPADVVEWMARTHGRQWADMMAFYLDHFEDALQGPVPGARMLLEDLKDAGIGVWGLSNWGRPTFERTWELYPILHALDGKVVSYEVGINKPDPRIYAIALERFGIDPHEAVFVDDLPANVLAANRAGLRAIRFRDPRALRHALAQSGIPIPDPE